MALGWVASLELDLGQQPVQMHLPRLPLPLLPGQSSRQDGGIEAGTVLKLLLFQLSLLPSPELLVGYSLAPDQLQMDLDLLLGMELLLDHLLKLVLDKQVQTLRIYYLNYKALLVVLDQKNQLLRNQLDLLLYKLLLGMELLWWVWNCYYSCCY